MAAPSRRGPPPRCGPMRASSRPISASTSRSTNASMLTVEALTSGYGRIEALHGVSLDVPAGAIVCLVGANGAGKTTLLRALSGVVPIARGSIRFEGEPIERLGAHH